MYAWTSIRSNVEHRGDMLDVEITGIDEVVINLFRDWELEGRPTWTIKLAGEEISRQSFDELFPGEFDRIMSAGVEWNIYRN